MQTGIAYGHGEVPWVNAISKSLGNLADPIGYDEFSFTPTRARIRGFGHALRAVWESVDLETLGLVTTDPRDAADQHATDPAPEPGQGA